MLGPEGGLPPLPQHRPDHAVFGDGHADPLQLVSEWPKYFEGFPIDPAILLDSNERLGWPGEAPNAEFNPHPGNPGWIVTRGACRPATGQPGKDASQTDDTFECFSSLTIPIARYRRNLGGSTRHLSGSQFTTSAKYG